MYEITIFEGTAEDYYNGTADGVCLDDLSFEQVASLVRLFTERGFGVIVSKQ